MTVTTERSGHVLVIRNERPAKRNAIDAETTAGFDAALGLVAADPDLRVAVLTGTDTVFSAGTDLAQRAGDPTPEGGEYGVVRRRRTKPLIAAVEGIAYGGGMEIVLACDLVVAGRSARFGLPEVARGVIATCGGLFRAQRALPPNIARQLSRDPLLGRGDPVGCLWELLQSTAAARGTATARGAVTLSGAYGNCCSPPQQPEVRRRAGARRRPAPAGTSSTGRARRSPGTAGRREPPPFAADHGTRVGRPSVGS